MLKINAKFRDLIPPLTTAERQQLHDNIVDDGCVTETIKVWDGNIVDGHNRYEIATEEGIEYSIEYYDFESEQDAIEWILKNQLGRRNLSPDDASELRGRLYKARKESKGGDQKSKGQNALLGKSLGKSNKTASEIAEETGVNEKTVRRDEEYVDALDSLSAPVREAIKSKDVKATKSDVKTLAEFDKQSQAAIVGSVQSGEVATLKDALHQSDPTTEEETLDPLEMALSQSKEFDQTARKITEIEKWIDGMLRGPAAWMLRESGRTILTDLRNAKAAIKFCKPFKACPYCSGCLDRDEMSACTACKGFGWLNKKMWDSAPDEVKA